MKIMQKILLFIAPLFILLPAQASASASTKKAQTVDHEAERMTLSTDIVLREIELELKNTIALDDNLLKKYTDLSKILLDAVAKGRDFISTEQYEKIINSLLEKLDNELNPPDPTINLIENTLVEYFDKYSSAQSLKIKKALNTDEHTSKTVLENRIKDLIDRTPQEEIIHNTDHKGNTVLQNAMKYNCLFAVQYLIEKVSVPMPDLADPLNQKALRSCGSEIKNYFKEKQAKIDANLKKKEEELDKIEQASEEQKKARAFWKNKQQEKKKKALDALKHFAQNNKAKKALDAKARKHAQEKVEKPALKKAVDTMHGYAQDATDEKLASKLFNIGIKKKSFNKWKSTALLQKNQRKQEQIYTARAEKFHNQKLLKTAFAGFKDTTEKAKQYESELEHKERKYGLDKKCLQAKKTLATWKEKTTAQTHRKKEIARIKEELQADLDQYYYHCDELDLQPDRSAIIELQNLAEHGAKTVSLDEKFNYYVANREQILSKMYTALRKHAAEYRQNLEQLMDQELAKDILDYKQKCEELNIKYESRYLSELTNLANLTRDSFSIPEHRIFNYRVMRPIPLKKAKQELDNVLNSDYILFKEMCIQSMAILNGQQILNKANYFNYTAEQIKRIIHNIKLHQERAARENLHAQVAADRQESHVKINTILNNLQKEYAAQTRTMNVPQTTMAGSKDVKHSAESQTNTAVTDAKVNNESDSDEDEKVYKSAAHKLGAFKLAQFMEKREMKIKQKAREVLQYWNFEFDNGRCTEREKAILKKEGALKLQRFLERKQQQELRKAWQKLTYLKTDKAAQAPLQLAPSVAALFAAWDSQQAARAVSAKGAQEAQPAPAGKEESEKLMLSPLKKTEIIKGTRYEFEIVPYEQGQTELHTAILTNDIARVEELLNSGAEMSTRYTKQITNPQTGQPIAWAISTSDVIRSPEMKQYIHDKIWVMILTKLQNTEVEKTKVKKKDRDMLGESEAIKPSLAKWRCANISKK